ncbi:hypothetical protein [Acinetobacter rudis]|uniref:Uncharacterized protein n=1 Tax=Acinetobacter rudis CIP 110305 TaxID=421052 RepID=S3N618_9GAMM|nr:hypothetical protein [Acinetobacter rudis]EPF73898.1 hypothetical protein F945_01777 [Acinetobacter rudis CIP 110305]
MNLPGFLMDSLKSQTSINNNFLGHWFLTKENENISCLQEDSLLENLFFKKSLIHELSFKSLTEFYASKSILDIIKLAPTIEEYDFLNTLLIDETHHSYLFRSYLQQNSFLTLDDPVNEMAVVLNYAHLDVVQPFQNLVQKWVVEKKNFYAGIIIITIILEGVLAPTAELSERKWLPFYPNAAKVQNYANLDEIRHLTVCAEILKRQIDKKPKIVQQLKECIQEGLQLWEISNMHEIILNREELYQQGMQQNLAQIEDFYLVDGIFLKDTVPEQRIEITNSLVEKMQKSRLQYIGIQLDTE